MRRLLWPARRGADGTEDAPDEEVGEEDSRKGGHDRSRDHDFQCRLVSGFGILYGGGDITLDALGEFFELIVGGVEVRAPFDSQDLGGFLCS